VAGAEVDVPVPDGADAREGVDDLLFLCPVMAIVWPMEIPND